jgi:hypothetical protein
MTLCNIDDRRANNCNRIASKLGNPQRQIGDPVENAVAMMLFLMLD